MSEQPAFQPEAILERLVRAGVRFILIGGLAGQAHGSPLLTQDLDVCYSRDRDNLERLAGVLVELAAIRRGLPPDTPRMLPLDARTLRASSLFTLQTRFGAFDLLAVPDPGLDFDRLARDAVVMEFAGTRILVASLDDLIAMKRAAGRPKDLAALEILGALREEIDKRGNHPRS